MKTITIQPVNILLVEDDEADVLLAQRALSKANIWNTLEVVHDGEEALDYLTNQKAYADKERYGKPGVVFLDLNLPKLNGREVLARMRKIPELKEVPVVICSTSDYESDLEYGRAHGVQHYIIKPMRADNVLELMASMSEFKLYIGTADQ